MKRNLSIIALVALLASCALPMDELTSNGEEVKVAMNKPKDCKPVGKFEGRNEEGSMELATVHARNLAGERDADTMYINDNLSQGSLRRVLATGYICN